jgi:hypothetical protein
MPYRLDYLGSHRKTMVSGAITGVGAGTSSAGHILAARWASTTILCRPRRFEAECFLTTAFGAAQEVGFDLFITRSYSVAHSGGLAATLSGSNGRFRASGPANNMTDLRIGNAGALTNGTHTLDSEPIAYSSFDASAIRARMPRQAWDWNSDDSAPFLGLEANEGLIARNTIAMGATGVVRWIFTFEWDEYRIVT